MRRASDLTVVALFLAAFTLLLAGCGGGEGDSGSGAQADPGAREAPSAAAFPAAKGKTINQVLEGVEPSDKVVAPVGQVFDRGTNRYGFAVFEVDRTQIVDAEVAMYFSRGVDGKVVGPLPAQVESMETKPAFAAMTTFQDSDAAKVVYVVPRVPFNRDGEWIGVALIRNGDGFEAARVPSPVVGRFPGVPAVGERAPRVQTPTPASVGGDLARIDTRVPPSDMHADFAQVLGEKPVVLLFATPQFCQSRVCGPVVDVQAQVQAELGEAAEFIHMEIFEDNDPGKGVRSQVKDFSLPSEPWLFVVDREGEIRTRIEGAFGLGELRKAVRSAARS